MTTKPSVWIWEDYDRALGRFTVHCPRDGESSWEKQPFAQLEALRHWDCRAKRRSPWRYFVHRTSAWWWQLRWMLATALWPDLPEAVEDAGILRAAHATSTGQIVPIR